MKISHTIEETREALRGLRAEGPSIALVPTMGALHEGHLSLIRLAHEAADAVVVSLFVNPTQFGPAEDLAAYPRTWEQDVAACEAEGAALLFAPHADRIYAPDHSTYVWPEALDGVLCGASRPGHFRGVLTIVAKLFNIVQPDVAVFGEKDAQQIRLIERMVRDLDFAVRVVRAPTVREPDGLALSSRNRYLNQAERAEAVCLHEALQAAAAAFEGGERESATLRDILLHRIAKAQHARLDYAEIVDDATLQPVDKITAPALAALAVRFNQTRLIDNFVLTPHPQ